MLGNCEDEEGPPQALMSCDPSILMDGAVVASPHGIDAAMGFASSHGTEPTVSSGSGSPALVNTVSLGAAMPTHAELYAQRERLQLGNSFTMIGNLHNVASSYSATPPPVERQADFTRVMCWNAGGGTGTLRDREKLRFLASTMLQQRVHLACITEGKVYPLLEH